MRSPVPRGPRAAPAASGPSGALFAAAFVLLTLCGVATGAGLGVTLGEIRLPEPEKVAAEGVEPRFGEGASLVRMQAGSRQTCAGRPTPGCGSMRRSCWTASRPRRPARWPPRSPADTLA